MLSNVCVPYASPPFTREWSTAVNATASERYDTTNREACQFLSIDIEDKSRPLTNAKRRDKLYIRGTLLLAVDPLPSQHISFMLTAWVPAERSTRFYGEYVNGNRHTYQKTNDFHHCFTHIASPPFAREWSTAVNATASERYDTTNREACQFLSMGMDWLLDK